MSFFIQKSTPWIAYVAVGVLLILSLAVLSIATWDRSKHEPLAEETEVVEAKETISETVRPQLSTEERERIMMQDDGAANSNLTAEERRTIMDSTRDDSESVTAPGHTSAERLEIMMVD